LVTEVPIAIRTVWNRALAACTFDGLALAMLMAVVTIACALSPMQSDTWWHLRAGADIVGSHQIALSDSYSHTAYGLAWPNHEWLSQVVLYGAYRAGGLPLVTLLATAFIAVAWLLVWRQCDGPVVQRLVIVGLFLVPASMHWAPRPQAFSILLFELAVALILAERIWWLPPLFLCWANLHGAVVLGLVAVAAAFVAVIVDDKKRWRPCALVLFACTIATTLTPLGLSFWTEIPRSIARIRQYPIDEWRAPAITELTLLPFWLAAAALVLGTAVSWRMLLATGNRRARISCACALALLVPAATAVRNIGPFLMCAAPAVCGLIESRRSGDSTSPRRVQIQHLWINAAVAFATAAIVVGTIATAYRQRIPRLRWTPLPASSLHALDRCPGNLYNRYDEGGYLIWFVPGRRVFLDGRQDPYPTSLILDQLRIEDSGDYTATFQRFQIHCAYLPTSSPVSGNLVTAGWATLYRDPQWIVLADPQS
jgi:hypothetical protein